MRGVPEQWGDVWEDFHDVLLAHAREGEPSIPLATFEDELRKEYEATRVDG